MLQIADRSLPAPVRAVLMRLQAQVDAEPDYASKIDAAKRAWDSKTSTRTKSEAFQVIRTTLGSMCVGPIRCAYCEDSLADEIEHIRPKSLFPEYAFEWQNYLFSCGPCNGPKGNQYGVIRGGAILEFVREPKKPLVSPPNGPSALIDPRQEDPLEFLELDLGGVAPDGTEIPGTFEILPNSLASENMKERAKFTIRVLGLNREVMRVARENAFGGFRARLREYVALKHGGAESSRLNDLRDDLLSTPHLTVFAEMRRQQSYLPDVEAMFQAAPEASDWPLVPES